jgi:hypothetical protein
MKSDLKKLYQKIYSERLHNYGEAEFDRCPGVRYLPIYKEYLLSHVYDFGCGTNDTLKEIEKLNPFCFTFGIDWGSEQAHCKEDITKYFNQEIMREPSTALCLDVLEHIADQDLPGLILNLNSCSNQVISVHSGSSVVDGVELHINQKPIPEWHRLIGKWFDIEEFVYLDGAFDRGLFITERKV